MKELNKWIKELKKLMKENPNSEVVVGCVPTNREIETNYFHMKINACYLDNRAIYCGFIFYDEEELICGIMDNEGISEEPAVAKANKLMKTVIVIQAKGFPV